MKTSDSQRHEVLRLTKAQWRAIHRDYKGLIEGTRYALRLNPETSVTELCPVEIVG